MPIPEAIALRMRDGDGELRRTDRSGVSHSDFGTGGKELGTEEAAES